MDNFDNNVSNIGLYKIADISIPAQYDTYIDAIQQDNNYGGSNQLRADDQ
jgi:hypothetical protein